jgi:DHA1 family inner membrane transport protein
MRSATHTQALAGPLNVSMANAGIGLGAINPMGVASIGDIASAIAVVAVSTIPLIANLARRRAA